MNIILYHNYSENEKVVKQINQLANLEGDLKSEVSVLSPSIEVSGIDSIINQVNYCYIPIFGRYYYITNMFVISPNLVQLDLEVDVLMSFASQILTNYAVVERQEYNYNMQLRDTNIPTYNKTSIRYINFPNAFSTFSLVIPILGN